MYFIQSGEVEVEIDENTGFMMGDGEIVDNKSQNIFYGPLVSVGAYFGEQCLLAEQLSRRSASIRSTNICQLLELSRFADLTLLLSIILVILQM